ncbi:hypothetical protein phiK7B1_005 [Pseudomonas phage phiK7B1]|nr:hypothetical protein phiK7B1_005 [Pseudomonas phage phiK7B1]
MSTGIPKLDSVERRKIMEKAAEKQRQQDREKCRTLSPERDFTWQNTNFKDFDND